MEDQPDIEGFGRPEEISESAVKPKLIMKDHNVQEVPEDLVDQDDDPFEQEGNVRKEDPGT